jgi:multidrug transporter EmrE-like cation transporter
MWDTLVQEWRTESLTQRTGYLFISLSALLLLVNVLGLIMKETGVNARLVPAMQGLFRSRRVALSAIPLAVASTRLAPHIISALSGMSIAAVAVLSYFFLKEKLYPSDIFHILLMIGCIAALSLTSSDAPASGMNVKPLFILLVFPLALLLPIMLKRMDAKRKITLLGVFSGFESGLTVVLMNALAKEFNGFTGQVFSSPFLYLYLAVGLASVAAAQAAYRAGDVVLFTPVQVVSAMCYPLLCSFLIFSASVTLLHILLVLIMAAACWGIQRKR